MADRRVRREGVTIQQYDGVTTTYKTLGGWRPSLRTAHYGSGRASVIADEIVLVDA